MNVTIRKAKRSEASEILEFIEELAVYEKLENEVVATTELIQKTMFGDKPYAEVLFVLEDQTKVGIAIFFHSYSTFLAQPGIYLEDLFVKFSHRGKGYGKKLLSYLASLAVERNCGRLDWSVLDWNQPALDFYRSIGAKPMEDWTSQRLEGKSLSRLASANSSTS